MTWEPSHDRREGGYGVSSDACRRHEYAVYFAAREVGANFGQRVAVNRADAFHCAKLDLLALARREPR